MWELIRANKRRSTVLLFLMLALMMALGFGVGSALVPSIAVTSFEGDWAEPRYAFDPTGGFIGMGVAFFLWIFQASIAYFQGGRILLAVSHARPIEKEDHPQLFNVVEEMTIAARLPRMPKIYIIDDMAMNAFATGRNPKNAAVAITAGLLGRLNRDQLQGVMAHEIGHIKNQDILFMTMIGIMLGTIVMISEIFLRSLWYGGGRSRRYRSNSRGGGGAQAIIIVLVIVLAILAPILAQMIYFACSRRREYLADASAAVFTRYPEGLASALEVLAMDTRKLDAANRATAPMYIKNPFDTGSMALGLTSTHPPIEQRIRILRSLAGGVSFAQYQLAWQKAGGRRAANVPKSALREAAVPIRKPSPEEPASNPRRQMREAGDLLRKVNQFLFLACTCGMRLKLPPEYKQSHVKCPRCKRVLEVPMAQLATLGVLGATLSGDTAPGSPDTLPHAQERPPMTLAPLDVSLSRKGWRSFKCTCGTVKQISPSFNASKTYCSQCGREVHIQYQG
jgi:heat shock protein HtpX